MEKTDFNIALMIDADNISSKYYQTLINELKNFGKLTYKRIYGDFTDSYIQGWGSVVKENGLIPMQTYANVKGKNSTDLTMAIDAMDILYAKNVDCFCLATSDSDFTRLVSRLKESNMFVIGAGESKANKAYRQNYERFIMLDQLHALEKREQEKTKKPPKQQEKKPKPEEKPVEKPVEDAPGELTPKEHIYAYTQNFIEHYEGSADGWVHLSVVVQKLYEEYPEFNCKLYKAKTTRDFFESSNLFLLKQASTVIYIKKAEPEAEKPKKSPKKKAQPKKEEQPALIGSES